MAGTGSDAGELLRLLGLERVAAGPELLRMTSARFRPPQQAQLLATLRALGEDDGDRDDGGSDSDDDCGSQGGGLALARLAAHFDRMLDVRDELERFLLDLLKMLHFVASATGNKGVSKTTAARDPRVLLFAGLGDRQDRERLAKVFQALGAPASNAYCRVASTLPPKYLQELLRHFADDLAELQAWMKWLGGLRGSNYPSSTQHRPTLRPFGMGAEFLGRCVREQCLGSWLALLRPLDSPGRLAVIVAVSSLPVAPSSAPGALAVSAIAPPLKKLGRFLETTAMVPLKLLELDASVRRALPLLLDEFPTIALQLVLSKFGSNAALMELIMQHGLMLLGKTGLLHLLEALTVPSVTSQAAEMFLTSLFAFERLHALLKLFFQLEAASQLNLIQVTARVRAMSPERGSVDERLSNDNDAARLFDLLLANAQGRAIDTILQNLADLSSELVVKILAATGITTEANDNDSSPNSELAVLGECLEIAMDPAALTLILQILLLLDHEARALLVAWLHDIPGAVAQPVYLVLQRLLSRQTSDTGDSNEIASGARKTAGRMLGMLSTLHVKDKHILCKEIFRGDVAVEGGEGSDVSVDEQVLLFLADVRDVDGSQRHKMLRLLRLIPREEHGSVLLLLRMQPPAQQEALVRLMRSLPTDANLRLLRQMAAIPIDSVDALFELLLLIPKAECPGLAKVLTSVNVTASQLNTLITVAVDMKNQAASRELVMFTADLPPETRALFFDMLADKVPEKGVLLRMMSLSSRASLALLCRMVELLHRMGSWDVRSAFVEQLRSLDQEHEIEEAVSMLYEQEAVALRWAVTLLSPFAAETRTTFCRVMLQLGTPTERHDVFAKLVGIPKNRIGEFMAAVFDDQCAPVCADFLRVVSRMGQQFQFPLLPLLKQDEWWFFVQLMASATYECGTDDHPSQDRPHDTVNALASVLVRLVGDDSYLSLFRSVVRHALGCAVSLSSLLSVVTPFTESVDRLLPLLRYVHALGRQQASDRVPLLFRVLGQCSQPTLVFDICRIADVDDAMFALQRLDRMLKHDGQRHVDATRVLNQLAHRANKAGGVDADIADGFFNFVRHFRELEPKRIAVAASGMDRTVTPRTDSDFNRAAPYSPPRINSHHQYHATELSTDEQSTLEAAAYLASDVRCIPQTSPPSCRRVALERHVRHNLSSGQSFLRKRSTRKSWWQEMEQVDLIVSLPQLAGMDTAPVTDPRHFESAGWEDDTNERVEEHLTTREVPTVAFIAPSDRAALPQTLPPVSKAPSTQFERHKPKTRAVHSKIKAPAQVHQAPQLAVDSFDSAPSHRDEAIRQPDEQSLAIAGINGQLVGRATHSATTPAKVNSHESRQCATATPEIPAVAPSQHHVATFAARSTASNAAQQLARSESAPDALELRRWTGEKQRARHMRGLCKGLEQEPDYHVDRDCAARMLRKQCEDAYAHSAMRIRFSKTSAAQSLIFQARVRRALGQRQLLAVDVDQHSSALSRPDRLTMERAASVLALSEQNRALARSLSTTAAVASGTTLHERSAAALGPHSPLSVSPSR